MTGFEPGDIVTVQKGGHIVVMWAKERTWDEETFWQGLLCTNEVDMSTEWDYLPSKEQTGLPYDLLVQGELYGYFLENQVVEVLGHIDVDELRETACVDAPVLHGPAWQFKQQELTRMYEATLNPFAMLDYIEGKLREQDLQV